MPTLYLAFANHPDQPLENLRNESRKVYDILHPGKIQNQYDIEREEFLDLNTLARYLSQNQNDIQLFHFGGHATPDTLLLFDHEANTQGILTMLVQQSNLSLVFLNGCSTQAQVTFLLEKGIPAVIATSAPVHDTRAKDFAIQFYQKLANGGTIGESFDFARGYITAISVKSDTRPIAFHRGISLTRNSLTDAQNWGLYVRDEQALEWQLPKKPLNSTEMIDPIQLAAAAITVLTPYLAKGGEELTQGIGKDLWELIKKHFKSTLDKERLEKFQKMRGNSEIKAAVKTKLEDILAEDLEFAAILNDLLKRIPKPVIINTLDISGNDNIIAQGNSSSTITITSSK
jgi:hypothetical protein